MEVTDAWVLVGLELSATPSQQVFDCSKVLFANTLVFVELSPAIHLVAVPLKAECSPITLRTLENVIVCPGIVSCTRQKYKAEIVVQQVSPSQLVNTGDTETAHLFAALIVAP